MKTSFRGFLMLAPVLILFMVGSGCSPQKSQAAESQPTNPPVAAAPSALVNAPEISAESVPPVAPSALPPNIPPTSPLAQVVRLTQAGVDQDIIMVYITNSSRTFNLDSDKIIYATDLGVPSEVVTAMMQRDQVLQGQFAASQAAQLAEQLPPPAEPVPAAEPAPADTADVMTPPTPVTVNYFYDTLSPYGSWVEVGGYGRCWRPTAVVYNSTWQPYCDRGQWVYTDCGWYWDSDYAWGATFHYGRWFRDTSLGWCWYPGTVWAPSWVTWRYSDNYCGWAPLPPRTACQAGVGFVYNGSSVSVGFGFGLGASCFTFVPTQYFCNSHPRNYCVNSAHVTQIYNTTKVVNNIKIHGSGNNQIIINNGIPVQNVATTTQRPIRPVPVRELDRSFAHGGNRQFAERSSGNGGNRPAATGNAGAPDQAFVPERRTPMPRTPSTTATPQNPSHSMVLSGRGNTRPSYFEAPTQGGSPQQAVDQVPQTGQEQPASNPVRTQPERKSAHAVAPQRSGSTGNYRSPNYGGAVQAPPSVASPVRNFTPQTAPVREQQPVATRGNVRSAEVRQNISQPSRVTAPPVAYSAPQPVQRQPQPQAQPRIYSQPRNEVRQNYSAPAAVAPPQTRAPNYAPAPQTRQPAYAPAPSSLPQQANNGRYGNQGWGGR